ncbi:MULTISPECIES: OmpG porin family protein [unclassified Brenneria]|uniref:OmpG porin family protein n=1 Tax=unclassified Brenneria TaxID=2634434 RepID=UPI0018F07108|nr:OmpG porin family protein [Brenneria sp. L3-3C-1]MBJ7220958.1 hypothetical protein [Brenneria sp. L3-3C-1]MEE3642199.1 OmpG porin family protein [Brenneria sp. L3_3C_1]
MKTVISTTWVLLTIALLPAASQAAMDIMRNDNGTVVGVNPWSYLNEDVMWTTTRSSYPHGGKVHGNIKSKLEITDSNWKNSATHNGADNFVLSQAVLRHDSLPPWYLAFYNARETEYQGGFTSQRYERQTQRTQLIFGYEHPFARGSVGAELLGGSESLNERWQVRYKLYGTYRLTDRLAMFGYLYQDLQHKRSAGGEFINDTDISTSEIEPGIQYIITDSTGVWLRSRYSEATMQRKQWGDINDQDWTTRIGVWHNWDSGLTTTLHSGIGHYRKYNANKTDGEVFQNTRYKYAALGATYPVSKRFTVAGEVKASDDKQGGSWVTNGKAINMSYMLSADFNF